jgi:glycosyltransferase involved in cell wall biosynthesis
MRFLFWHQEKHGPLSLQSLWEGTHGYAGAVAKHRILFWIAERGHEVFLVGNVLRGEFRGVTAIPGDGFLDEYGPRNHEEPAFLVVNNFPFGQAWERYSIKKNRELKAIIWPNNPFDPRWLGRIREGYFSRVVCLSEYHRDLYRLYPGFESIDVIYYGVDVDLIEQAAPMERWHKSVLSCSIPRRTKGFHNLLRAWPLIRQAVPDAHLRVCGSARMHDPSVEVGRTGVLDRDLELEFPEFFNDAPQSCWRAGIELLGPLELSGVYTEMKSAAVAVVNCNWQGSFETFCRSAVEAQAAGVPVVGAARGALPEVIVHGKTGLLVDRPEPEYLAEAIVSLLRDQALREKMGEAGRHASRRFADYALLVAEWERMARQLLSGERPPVRAKAWQDFARRMGLGYLLNGLRRLKNGRLA